MQIIFNNFKTDIAHCSAVSCKLSV